MAPYLHDKYHTVSQTNFDSIVKFIDSRLWLLKVERLSNASSKFQTLKMYLYLFFMLPFRAVAIPLLDFVTWLQLLLVVAICVDRAGHICRPLRYTYNITACKTTTVLLMCTAIPILLLELPYVIAAFSTIGYFKREFGAEDSSIAFKCDSSRDFDQSGQERISESDIFMSKLQRNFNHRSLSSIQ